MNQLFTYAGKPKQTATNIKSVSARDFKEILDYNSVTIIDVRDAESFELGHIEGAINMDMYSPGFVAALEEDSTYKVLAVYCQGGFKSKMAASKLAGLNTEIYDLNSGFNEWVMSGYPITTP
jgi:rhodanese-related sulfurtransferase